MVARPRLGELVLSMRPFRAFRILGAFILLVAFAVSWVPAGAEENLLLNGDLDDGTGPRPTHWLGANLFPQHAGDTLVWSHQPGFPGELRIASSGGDTAEWSQTISLSQGWYHLSGDIETEGVGKTSLPPVLGIRVRGHAYGWSPPDATTWQHGDLYFRTGSMGNEVTIACQFGPPGTARFRHLRLTKESSAPPPEARQVDLDKALTQVARLDRRHSKPKLRRPYDAPTGGRWTIFAVMFLLLGVATWGWRVLGT